MNKIHTRWQFPVTSALVFATAAVADQDSQIYQTSTNRVTLSLRFGMNITGKFLGTGSSFAPGAPVAGNRRTPRGDLYNYSDGYVLNDISGNYGGQSWYWGYDHANQVNASAPNTIDFHRNAITGVPSASADADDSPYVGVELAYNYQLGVKEDWHQLRYGIEAAANWMPIDFTTGGLFNGSLSQSTYTYGYTPGTTPPSAPYQGSYQGPGFVIDSTPSSQHTTVYPGATLLAQQKFDANLWGFRLGPYIEYPFSQKWSLHLSGGLAVGVLAGEASWRETFYLPGGAGSTTIGGSGNDVGVLCGFYAGADGRYEFNDRWSAEAGVQFQDLGNYNHNYAGRVVALDLSQSIFVHVGISYSF